MKKIALALATLGMAAMFTACGDDSSSGGGSGNLVSCDINMSMPVEGFSFEIHVCGEVPSSSQTAAQVNAKCNSASAADFAEPGMDFSMKKGSGCAGGYVKTCQGADATMYLYDEMMSCEDFDMSDFL